jgi:hypothetical protein
MAVMSRSKFIGNAPFAVSLLGAANQTITLQRRPAVCKVAEHISTQAASHDASAALLTFIAAWHVAVTDCCK